MKNVKMFLLLLLPTIILFVYVLKLKVEVNLGKPVRVVIRGYDPRDLLAGHYISYRIDWVSTDCSQFEAGVCPKDDFPLTGRFYTSREEAVEIEKKLSSLWRLDEQERKNEQVELVFSYRKGFTPLARYLLVNGQEFSFVKQ